MEEIAFLFCDECGSQIQFEKMAKHKLEKHDKRVFDCDLCQKSVTGAKAFYQHKVCYQAQAQVLTLQSVPYSLVIVKLQSRFIPGPV